MNTATRLKARGTIIKVPDSSPGLLFVNSEQKSFTLERIWKSPLAPAPNMTVDVELDSSESIMSLTVVDTQQLAKERLTQFSGVAQEHGKQAVEIARQGIGALAARMGKVPLTTIVALWIAWFFLPVASISLFIVSKSFTFWELLGFDLNSLNLNGSSSHGLFSLIGLAAIAAPAAVPFLRHPRARLLNAMPIAFLLATCLKIWWTVNQAVGDAQRAAGGGNASMGGFASEMTESVVKSMLEAISLGSGLYVLVIATVILAVHAFRNPSQS